MRVSYYFLSLLLCAGFFTAIICASGYIRHQSSYLEEEFIGGIKFSYVLLSDCGKQKESFFINDLPVQQSQYNTQLEDAKLAQLRKEHERAQQQQKNNMTFIDATQTAIIEKLITQCLTQIQKHLDALDHATLKKHYLFENTTINTPEKLQEIREYTQLRAKQELQEYTKQYDMLALQQLLKKIESWPELLEKFFQNTMQHAIKSSDDTATLKELLNLLT